MSKRVAEYGMFVALSFLFAYIETWIPFSLGIPGAKLGLANLVTLTALYVMGTRAALLISLGRIVLTGFTFGNLSMMLYSLAGGVLSFVVMAVSKRRLGLSKMGVSVSGGVAHNLGQLLMAVAVVQNRHVLYYFPFLLLWGSGAGAFIGILGGMILRRLPKKQEEIREKKRLRWGDRVLLGACVVVSLVAFLLGSFSGKGDAKEAVVYIGNEEYARYDLEESFETDIPGLQGGSNHLVIGQGRAQVTQATCPDHVCVGQGEISEIGQAIVCMPHQVIIAVETAKNRE
ncbi:MAG: hypothetical protein HFI33_12220 [Lachnospiraceae bacterium]|nr:hypothetical protein [Lachnospiraceae bacterium]